MKLALSAGLLALATQLTQAHYTFPDFISGSSVSSDWQYVRITANHYSQGPLTNVKDPEFRCYELDLQASAGQTGTATVSAGSTVGFKASNTMGHPGYFSAYMSPASPAANSASAATGATWFKVWEAAPTGTRATGLTFPYENAQQITFNIPKSVPSGQYLLRFEQIALHAAGSYQGAQFYVACAQLNVINGGNGNPSPKVSIPGVYTGYEPGILINIYGLPANFTTYPAPGPAVWQG